MHSLTVAEMLAAESRAIGSGWSEEMLLDLAGTNLGHAIGRQFPKPGTVIGYCGKGHNGGDALVALKILRSHYGWRIGLRMSHPAEDCAPLVRRKLDELGDCEVFAEMPDPHRMREPLLLLDALLGTGACGEPRGTTAGLIREMAKLREQHGATLAAIDLPSGMDADTGAPSGCAATADITFMIGNAKRGLLTHAAVSACGMLAVVPVAPLTHGGADAGALCMTCPQTLAFAKAPRAHDMHKGTAGRVHLITGSSRYPGAAALACLGALHGGAGLVTLHVPTEAAVRTGALCPPEVILRPWDDEDELSDATADADALVVGCGLGPVCAKLGDALVALLSRDDRPAVIDADALALLTRADHPLRACRHHVLTPHPGEFARLAPELGEEPREAAAAAFARRCAATLVLKGARTLVTRADQAVWANPTGHSGMASGGQGDLLAGLIGALLASGLPPFDAARLAPWLAGRAAEVALEPRRESHESLTATKTAASLGTAFLDWRAGTR